MLNAIFPHRIWVETSQGQCDPKTTRLQPPFGSLEHSFADPIYKRRADLPPLWRQIPVRCNLMLFAMQRAILCDSNVKSPTQFVSFNKQYSKNPQVSTFVFAFLAMMI